MTTQSEIHPNWEELLRWSTSTKGDKMKKYFQPKSVTWWSGVALLIKSVATSIIEKRVDVEGIAAALAVIGFRGAIK